MADILELIKQPDKNLFIGLAGPGTGKTHTFRRIADSHDFQNKKILILSFIKKLIADLSANFESYKNVDVMTLHAFAGRQFTSACLEKDLDHIISEDNFFLAGNTVDYETLFHNNKLTNRELKFYENRKNFYRHQDELYSFNSIVHAVSLLFKKDESKIPEYDLILIDEFQDFNQLEWRLIELLNKKTKVILVGDDNQALYHSFRKSKPELIRALFDREDTQEFTLDYCYRCPRVIVTAVNSLIVNAKHKGYLKDNRIKEFKYPEKRTDDKNEISEKYNKIDFLAPIPGNKLIYHIKKQILIDARDNKTGRILIIAPFYLRQNIYDGLIKEGFNVVEFALFSGEEKNKFKHRDLVETFNILILRKTDNLALRKILNLYLKKEELKGVLLRSSKENKKLWSCLERDIRLRIENDINIFKKARAGKLQLNYSELERFNELFNLKNIFSRMLKGFRSVKRGAIEVELVTVMKSKGLSADFVYYVGIDDRNLFDREKEGITDQQLCEFLVGITRAEKKLTLISLNGKNPQILDFIDKDCINKTTFE